MKHKRRKSAASLGLIGSIATYVITGATGVVIDVEEGYFYDSLVILTDTGNVLVRSIEDCDVEAIEMDGLEDAA